MTLIETAMINNMYSADTIAAVATAVGGAGIGIIKISGKDALKIADKIFVPFRDKKPSQCAGYTVHYGHIRDSGLGTRDSADPESRKPKTETIDEVLLTVMCAPCSYTKEDIVEINCHGGVVAMRKVLDLVLANGARLAEPGEFTRRAFLNGRIDLAQAESVLVIINAKTDLSLECASSQLKGDLSAEIFALKEKILDILALLEANIDFPEDDIDTASYRKLAVILTGVSQKLKNLLNSSNHGKILREGINLVIAGRANVGKSSLLNALLKQERAIVTPIAGTTRDVIEEILDLKGIPLKIADTAGIIEPKDLIEKEALKRSRDYFDRADLILLTFDGSQPLAKHDRELISRAKGRQVVVVLNKCDLKSKIEIDEIRAVFPRIVKISSLKSLGLEKLENEIADLIWGGEVKEASNEVIVSNARHIQNLKKAQEAVKEASESLKSGLSIELIAESLKISKNYLARVTGEVFEEDILDRIFEKFCIGK